MIRGNVAVVRHGATAPSTQSGAVLLELSPSRMRDSGWDQLPPDVRFAGEALQKMRAPPWIAIYLNQPLTEKPSCEAGHMTASDFCAARYTFAAREPSTHEAAGVHRAHRLRAAVAWSRTRAAALPTDATDRLICNPRVSQTIG